MSSEPTISPPDDDPRLSRSAKDYALALGAGWWGVIACTILGDVICVVLAVWALASASRPEWTGWWIWLLFGAVITVQIVLPFLAFHNQRLGYIDRRRLLLATIETLQNEVDALKRRLKDRENRKRLCGELADLVVEGSVLRDLTVSSEEYVGLWKVNRLAWQERMLTWASQNLGDAEAKMLSRSTGTAFEWENAFDDYHNKALCHLDDTLTRLRSVYDRLAQD